MFSTDSVVHHNVTYQKHSLVTPLPWPDVPDKICSEHHHGQTLTVAKILFRDDSLLSFSELVALMLR